MFCVRVVRCVSVALLLALGIVLSACSRMPEAPKVQFATLAKGTIDLDALRGQVVLVNFWATTCGVCQHEMPEMVQLYRRYAPKVELIAVAMSYDVPWLVADYATKTRLPFPVALDLHGDVAEAFGGVVGTPTLFVLGRDGKIRAKLEGAHDFPRLEALIERELMQG